MAETKNLLLLFLCNLFILKVYSKCPKSFLCAPFGSLRFPFSDNPNCGILLIEGCDSGSPTLHFSSQGSQMSYNILGNISSNKLTLYSRILQTDLNEKSCTFFRNLSLIQSPFISFKFPHNLTFFMCWNQSADPHIQDYFGNHSRVDCDAPPTVYYRNLTTHVPLITATVPTTCSMSQLPIKSSPVSRELFDVLTAEFNLEWAVTEDCYKCNDRGGQCVSDSMNKFHCREKGNYTTLKKILFIGGTTIAALTSALTILFVFIRRKRAKAKQEHEKDIKLFLKNNGNLVPMRYKYSSIKKMTKSFSENLGKGGYGSVYKGQFPDGHLVAVKILNESNGNGEEFMNEVASISRTSHINIVALLGFCFEGSKRALIYDFMPNGSLEKLIAGNTASSSAESGLGWDKLFEIALGIARGLEYLHQGCNTRILHLDIKPQNILLDRDLNPRISDFGLAKLCPNRSSIVSMLVARGTVGYIAPEVFSRNFGEVSYKSDVYSYGMLVLEMVGARKNIDPRDVDDTSEIYFPRYIYKQLEMDAERNCDLHGAMNEDESQVTKRNLIIVGLWCIQTNPKDRPSMTKVVEMLEGKLGALEVPPKPYLYSPPRTAPSVSTSESLWLS